MNDTHAEVEMSERHYRGLEPIYDEPDAISIAEDIDDEYDDVVVDNYGDKCKAQEHNYLKPIDLQDENQERQPLPDAILIKEDTDDDEYDDVVVDSYENVV